MSFMRRRMLFSYIQRSWGPEAGEEIKEISTFPYVVVKLEYIDKNVIFD